MDLTRKPITLDNIRELVSDESVWHWLFPDFTRVGKKFKGRSEDDPSSIIKPHNNILFFKDFGSTNQPAPWWVFLKEERGTTYSQALELVSSSFNLSLGITSNKTTSIVNPKLYPKKEYKESVTIIRYRSREWGWSIDNEYWYNNYQFSVEDLKYFKILPLKYYWINNGINYRFSATKSDPVYCYPLSNRRKIYRPLNKEGFKWSSNTTKEDTFGLHLLKDFDNIEHLLIESSYKDTCVMYKAEYPSLPTPSENSFLPDKLFREMIKKGIKPILHFDNDEAGIRNAKIFSEKYEIPYITIPERSGTKDPSDFVAKYGYEELKRLINKQIKKIC